MAGRAARTAGGALRDRARQHLEAQENVTQVLQVPGPRRARNTLEGQIAALLEAQPDMLTQNARPGG
jgi:hypothetical protein